jgi:cytochrome P450
MPCDYPLPWITMRHEPPVWSARDNGWRISRYADGMAALGLREAQTLELRLGIVEIARRSDRSLASLVDLLGSVLICRNPPFHPEARQFLKSSLGLMAEALSRPAVNAIAEAVVDAALAEAIAVGRIDAMPVLAERLPAFVIARALGLKDETVASIAVPAAELMTATAERLMPREYIRLNAISQAIVAAITQDMAEAAPGTGIAAMRRLNDAEYRFPPADMVALVFFIVAAATMTTTALLGNVLHCLAARPDHWRQLQETPGIMSGAVNELVRYVGPFRRASSRSVGEDVVIGDVVLPAGSSILVDLETANHDPAAFAQPGLLDFNRRGPPHLGFGYGAHACLGSPLARLEAASLLQALLSRCDIGLVDDHPDWQDNYELRRLKSLPLVLTRTRMQQL